MTVSSMYGRGGTMRDVEAAAAILGEREEIGEALVSHRFPLSDAVAASWRGGGQIETAREPTRLAMSEMIESLFSPT